MLPVGFAILLLSSCPTAPPNLAVAAPRLQRGDELVYTGEILESVDRPELRFQKKQRLEVRLFVIEANEDVADCAVMTSLTTLNDDKVAQAVSVVSGSNPSKNRPMPTVQLQWISVDQRGRLQTLEPAGPPPLNFTKAEAKPIIAVPLDAVPVHEFGFFVPLPLEGAKVDSTWAVAEAARTPTVWNAKGEAVWNGGRCIELTALQKSTGWDQPDTTHEGWHRSESMLVSPVDGFASVVQRDISRRAGRDVVGRIGVKYELQQTNRFVGMRYTELRSEIEQAWHFGTEWNTAKRPSTDWQTRASKVQRYLDDHPNGGSFRPALESLQRRFDAAAHGTAPPVVATIVIRPVEPVLLRVGYPAPDFVVADVDRPTGRFRLSANKLKPTVAIFFKPGSPTSRETLLIAEALQQHFGDKISVVPLAIGGKATEATKQREELKLKLPVYDGLDIREAYQVATFPQFFILEPTGLLNWTFEAGVGPETGFLVKQQLEKLLK